MTGWKLGRYGENVVLIELSIPNDARIHHIRKRKGFDSDRYRCDKAFVNHITSLDGKHEAPWAESLYLKMDLKSGEFHKVTYEVGKMAHPNGFDPKGLFGRGIYFFDTKEKAINY